jgi:predicted RecA/RadA family phage recombinase
MTKKYHQAGGNIDWTNSTGALVTSGSFVVIGGLLGIAHDVIADGDTGAVHIEGVWELPKGANAIGLGAAVDYDVSAGKIDVLATPASGDLVGCGVAVAAAGAGDTTVLVKLNAAVASVTA